METSEIDFCNKTAYNIKNIRYKYNILEKLSKKYKINISDNYIKFSNKIITKFNNYDYLLSILTMGTSYLLYLTKINNENFTIFIDKKILNGHKLPKIIIVNYRFHDSLYCDTIFEGELLKNNKNNWSFVINDILIYKSKHTSKNLINRIKLLYNLLDNYYIKDNNIEICNLYIKEYFHPKDLKFIYNNYINTLKYKIKGIIFNQVTYNNKIVFNFTNFQTYKTKFNFPKFFDSYMYSLNEEKNLLQEIEKNNNNLIIKNEEDILLSLLENIETNNNSNNNTTMYNFEIELTEKPNIYYLYCDKNNKRFKHSIARIDTLECSNMLREKFKKKKKNIYVSCLYSIEYKKWIPIKFNDNTIKDDYNIINNYCNKFIN